MENTNWLAVIRLRGNVGISREREYAFKLMHLTRKNHTVLIEDTSANQGSIRKVKDYSTWGEITFDTLYQLLEKRGRLKGNQKLSEQNVQEKLGYGSIKEVAEAIYHSKVQFKALPTLKPVFRLHPPRKGFHGSIKKPYPEGELGYRGTAINGLITRMI
ncbi:MAG: 50S ribosomal protein L30 [Candidatus Bathyarchaeota archaeon]|nr:MAG: 50S ribosomal protein L30 [Candidatus Bathyarchaeota archaeon]